MKDGGASIDHEAPLASNSVFSEASPTLWKDNDEEEMEEAARVIWKASQPQDPVLNRLMEDALTLGNPVRLVQTKSWSPSPSSCTTTTSSSKYSVSGRTSKSFRTGKRRTFATNLHQEEAVPAQKDDFDENIQRLVALLPAVSKKADENAKREQEELRRKLRSEKKAARLLAEGRSGTKKRRSPIDCKGKQPTIDDLQEEEISVIAEDSSTSGDMHSDRGSAGHEVTTRSLTSRNMPPPPLFVPLRKSWSGDGSFSSAFTQRLSRSALGTTETERGPEELSFNSSSFSATSTPHPPSAAASSNLTREPFAKSKSGTVADKNSPPSVVNVLSSPKLTVVETNSQASSHSLPARRDYDSHYNPACLPSQSGPHALSSQVPASKIPHPPKLCGPPVLGMRRLPHSQNFSLSQDRPLPVKRDRFRVPFAKPKPENRNQAEVSAAASNQSMSRSTPSANSLGGNTQKISADSKLGRVIHPDNVLMPQAQSSQNLSSKASPTNNRAGELEVNKINADRVSPQADPDSSMDYDMGIDPEELERVCSVYD
ncbi:hypothetical protein A7U60_g767 [Sanghuangporus baumii]|uniref:Uncharacterized protein n=1 Tax=Sanghuangporus baumii TaxID=108892 RepID=A0A9Q5I673_SANBA|nr:hypothetical protein A7U60_g767 [Sanghuangporus baumii]